MTMIVRWLSPAAKKPVQRDQDEDKHYCALNGRGYSKDDDKQFCALYGRGHSKDGYDRAAAFNCFST